MARLLLLLALLFWTGPARAQDACAALARMMGDGGGPRFLPSYPTATDARLKDAAFLYDNAVAAIALVGCGDRARAMRIGDALLLALDGDRHWRDGRLRNAYLAGAATLPVKLPGWWEANENKWVEDRIR